ncbi:aspartate kinase [Tenacibaculum agarivorans]|uniref:aspartate kinase n=1 Tax=Tenacibaculum agarivorans TaxID=1908389 RepID=UPI00094BC66A|nr:aspartate kinase [Tenacibaculum agarivorans]
MEILKFGGSSVSSKVSLENMVQIVRGYNLNNEPLIIVVSALKGVTNHLVDLVDILKREEEGYNKIINIISKKHQEFINVIFKEAPKSLEQHIKKQEQNLIETVNEIVKKQSLSSKDYDKIISFGELFSAQIIAAYLNENQLNFCFKDAREFIITDTNFTNAKIDWDLTTSVVTSFFAENKRSYVVTGFIARSIYGDTTTLGRGGSDYTATILATILKAEKVTKWTDVNGIMTADPNKVLKASSLENITFSELRNLSKFGSNVLVHPESIDELSKHNIPFLIRNTFDCSFKGTQVINEEDFCLQKALSAHQACSIVSFDKNWDLPKTLIKEIIDKNYLFFRVKTFKNDDKSYYVVANDCINFFSENFETLIQEIGINTSSNSRYANIIDDDIVLITVTSQKMDKKEELKKIKETLELDKIEILGYRLFFNSICMILKEGDFKRSLGVLHGKIIDNPSNLSLRLS